jgi:hypothetical protein
MELRERCASWRLGITLEVRAHRGLVELGAIFERDGGLGAPSIVWAGIRPIFVTSFLAQRVSTQKKDGADPRDVTLRSTIPSLPARRFSGRPLGRADVTFEVRGSSLK